MATDSQLKALKENAKLGGYRRAQSLTPQRRREIAIKAAKARWYKKSLTKPQACSVT